MFIHLADYYYRGGEKEKVIEVLDKMEEVMPSSVIPLKIELLDVQIGRLYADCGRPEELGKRLDLYSANEAVNHERLFEYGVLYKSVLNDNQKAINVIKKVIDIKRDFTKAYSFLLFIYEQEKLYEDELELLEQWLTVNPNDSSARKKTEDLRVLIAKSDSAKIDK